MTALLAPVPALQTPPGHSLAQIAVLSLQSPHSRRAYARQIDRFIASGLPLSREGVQEHVARLRATVGAVSVNHAVSAIRLLAREANIRGQLSDRDLYAIETVKPVKATGSRLGNWLELDGLKSLILAVSQTEHATRNQAVVAIMAGCGLRRSEAASLVWAQWQERGGRYVIVDIQGKGNRTRSVPAPDWVGRYVEAWRIESMGLARVSARASESIFGLGDHALYYIVRDAARRAGLGDIAPHDLRRSYSKLSRDGGASLEQIQVTLGHSNIETTQRYLGTQLELRRGMACGDYIQMDGTAT